MQENSSQPQRGHDVVIRLACALLDPTGTSLWDSLLSARKPERTLGHVRESLVGGMGPREDIKNRILERAQAGASARGNGGQ